MAADQGIPVLNIPAMRAIIIKEFGGLDSLVIENLPAPKPEKGQALIEVQAFGMNHAETHMRKGQCAEAAKVNGIECVGVVRSCPEAKFRSERRSLRSWADWDARDAALNGGENEGEGADAPG